MGKLAGLVFTLLAATLITAEAATISGVVKEGNSEGGAVEGAIISVSSGGGGQSLLDTTDASGAYSITGVKTGERKVKVSKTGFSSISDTVTVSDSTASYTADFYLTAQVNATLSGTVKDSSTGLVLEGAKVVLRAGTFRDTAVTDATGVFSFPSVATGSVTLNTSFTGYSTKSTTVTVAATNEPVSIVLAPVQIITVSGVVNDIAAGTALAGAQVVLRSGTTRDTVSTNAAGIFSFTDVTAGSITFTTSLTGYTTKSSTFSIVASTDTIKILLATVQYGSITGTVTDSSAGTPVSGAMVILRQSSSAAGAGGGGAGASTPVDTFTTGADGAYLFANISAGSYSVKVTMTGYNSKTVSSLTVSGSVADTANVMLSKTVQSSIVGTVYEDSLGGGVVSGATVILSSGSGTGGITGTALDTATTGTDGKYTFENVTSGSRYRIAATMTGYSSGSASINSKSSGTDTANIIIVKAGTGTLLVRVINAADSSSALAGASVTGVVSGVTDPLSGATGTDGTLTFKDFSVSGTSVNVSLTVILSGYSVSTAKATVPKNGSDTVTVYLNASAEGTKVLRGAVTDSATAAPLANAIVKLTVSNGGGGAGGSSLTFIDTTGTDGLYIFNSIPVSRTSGSISVEFANYKAVTKGGSVTLGIANTADTTVLNISMIPFTAVLSGANVAMGPAGFNVLRSGMIQFNNVSENGIVKIFTINGKVLYQSAINAGIRYLSLPAHVTMSGKTCIVSLKCGKVESRKEIVLP